MKFSIILSIICIVCLNIVNCQLNIIKDIIQYNVAGIPLIHKVKRIEFDPDVSLRRRKQFEELHGEKAEKLIERLGLGIDGYADERLQQQRARDEGHLGGLNYLTP
ncbi:uncharacterized protein LOC123293751 [Chrysoperla carnea]|uniref:uncharacterized protein LOC123293751 n=1 Tax=Chrysoperla carnea TaxID=189513 RepID=UPI001D07A1F6|nr:uncharacterized protein LOC123293751 [Chrysoperla carnea]